MTIPDQPIDSLFIGVPKFLNRSSLMKASDRLSWVSIRQLRQNRRIPFVPLIPHLRGLRGLRGLRDMYFNGWMVLFLSFLKSLLLVLMLVAGKKIEKEHLLKCSFSIF